jgi:molecular chaperone GrpE (heat shock protein)
MDNVEKLRVMLQHWIEHNKGHVEEFDKWQKTMIEEGQKSIADSIAEAVKTMATVNDQLEKTLKEAGGPGEKDGKGHHHHDHGHHHH